MGLPDTLPGLSTYGQLNMHAWADNDGPGRYTHMWSRFAAQCSPLVGQSGAQRMRLDDRSWEAMQRVNRKYNASIHYDRASMNRANLLFGGGTGECVDYVVTKRAELIRNHGWPHGALAYTLCVAKDWQYFAETKVHHVVLTARCDRGDLILNNEADQVLHAQRTGYDFWFRSVQGDTWEFLMPQTELRKRWRQVDRWRQANGVVASPGRATAPPARLPAFCRAP